MAPNLRTNRVVPPAPGKMPTMISGRPIFALGLLAAKMRCVANGISKPIPRAVPGSTETIGLPPLLVFASIPARSILRRMWCICMTPSNMPCAGLSPDALRRSAKTFKSIPAAKSFLPDVMMAPLMASSAITVSMNPSKVRSASQFNTFMDLSAQSHVITAMPSASVVIVKSVIILNPYTRSMIVAAPMPEPMHNVARPVSRSERSISSNNVPRIIAPVAPNGWPMAIEPPFTFTRS